MSESTVNERRNWKAQTFPYDHFIPDESPECQYCLTDLQAEILRGIIEPLAWHTRWWSDTDTPIDKDEIQAFRDDLIRRLMMGCCGDETPIQFRFTVGGVLQISSDGGTTWTDAPEFDPRNNSTEFTPVPGADGDDKKCIAATGMVALIKEQVGDQLTDDMSRYTLGQLLTDWLNTLINSGANIFEALITIASNQIFALVISALRAALTEDVYDILLCIFYCNMEDDASFTEAGVGDVRGEIIDQIAGVAGIFLEHLVYLLGVKGMTNLARSQAVTEGDCSDCDCPEPCAQHWFVPDVVPGYGPYYGVIIEQTDTSVTLQCHTPIPPGLVNYYGQIQTTSLSDCCYLNSIDVLEGDAATAYLTCGDGGAPGFGLGPLNTCVWTLQPQSTIPFTLRFNFAECP